MDEEATPEENVIPVITLDNDGPFDKKILAAHAAFGLVMTVGSIVFAGYVQRRTLRRVREGLKYMFEKKAEED